MSRFLAARYRQVSDRLEAEALAAAVRGLRVQLAGEALSTLTLCGTFAALAALVVSGRLEAAAAGRALVALRASTSALTTLSRSAARVFCTGLYLRIGRPSWTRLPCTAPTAVPSLCRPTAPTSSARTT
ncbi:hypothetical protein ACWCV9_35910 [Streptomyces sp. NPDC001606]